MRGRERLAFRVVCEEIRFESLDANIMVNPFDKRRPEPFCVGRRPKADKVRLSKAVMSTPPAAQSVQVM